MNPDSPYRPPHPSKSPTPTREMDATGSSRAEIYLDDETLQRMIDSFGPLEYPHFAATLQAAELGIETAGQWRSDISNKKPKKGEGAAMTPENLFLMDQQQMGTEESNPEAADAKRESLIEWFDRSVEKELDKRRDTGSPTASPVDPAMAPLKAKHTLHLSKGTAERLAEASGSRIELAARLETDFTTELTDAVEKLAKAETMSHYTEALQAAELAVQNAPPELMEQMAASEARRIQTNFSKIAETIPGVRPIEVIGYVGITKPAHPQKPR